MKKILVVVLWAIFLQQAILLKAQDLNSKYELKLKSGNYIPKEGIESGKINGKRAYSSSKDYVLIQFYQLPSAADIQKLKSKGIELFNYIPDYAYWGSIPSGVNRAELSSFNIRAIEAIQPAHKIDPLLTGEELPAHALKEAGKIDLLISYFQDVEASSLQTALSIYGAEKIKETPLYHQAEIRVAISKIESIASIGFISYVAPVNPQSVGGDLRGRASHRVNGLQSGLTGSLQLKGEGVMVGIGDKGFVSPHPDLLNRVTNIQLTNLPDSWSSMDHADHVSGIVAGNGNKSEDAIGMAPKASLVTDFAENIIYNAPQYVTSYNMVLTNNSYWWNSSYGVYNSNSNMVDAQLLSLPSLLHVIISGNPGSDYGKTEGNFAAAKNTLTVGSLTSEDIISSYSGRGPCVDGRLKPEIVSVGQIVNATIKRESYQYASGTSMACPGVVGSLALLYEQYKKTYGSFPNSGLAKALICNSADDLGNPGPDYTYGFGRVNIQRSVEALNANRYVTGTVSPGNTTTHSINVPSGIGQLRVMLYWKDKEASTSASVALVNNLNLSVAGNGTTYQPWILTPSNPSANASRGVDNINNIEQVTVDAPASGTYTVTINGSGITTGLNQEYFLVYDFIQNGIRITYPVGGEQFNPGMGLYIRWDAFGNAPVTINYSSDNGNTWNLIASNVPVSQSYIYWAVPSVTSPNVLVRISDGTYTSTSAAASIMQVPVNISATHTGNSINASWNAVSGATSYQVYFLNAIAKEIQQVGTTSSTNFTITGLAAADSGWVSVKAVAANGAVSSRADAVKAVYNNNTAPTVSITSPANNTTYAAGATIIIDATASDADGTVSKVEFYQGAVKLGEDLSSPYSYTWNSVAQGSYQLTAKAIDNLNGSAISSVINIVVNAPVCADPEWSAAATYTTGNKVSYNGRKYTANWWNQNRRPDLYSGSGQEWTDNGPCAGGNIAPTANITSPLNNATFASGSNITIDATATDADGTISKVEFYQGTTKLGEDLTSPYSYAWNSVATGTYALTVKSYDNLNAVTTSAIVNIVVNNGPAVSITSPANNSTFTSGSSIVINATAADADGTVSKVEFYQGTTKLGEDLSSPYSFTWNNASSGSYALTAKATDNLGTSTTSAAVNISVTGNALPTAAITSPANGASFTAPASISITATATDADGTVSKVEFFQNGVKIGESLSSPYSLTWSNVAAGTYALTAVATDNTGAAGNASAAVNVTVSGGTGCSGIAEYSPYPTIYNTGALVKYNNIIYEAQVNNLYNVTPGTAEHWWKTIGPCSGALKLAAVNASEMVVYPNPATSEVTFNGKSNSTLVTVSIINDMGMEISKEEVNVLNGSFEFRTDIAHLPAGFYIIRTTADGSLIAQKKMIKN